VLTVGMINMGIFELLAETYGRVKGAFYLAGANAAIAAILVLIAVLKKPGPEQAMVAEIRDMALDELHADADAIKAEYDRIADHVRQIEDTVSTLTGSGSTLSKVTALSPVVELAVEALKSRHDK
jgi:sugar phosphate permease